jgi:hypothetical protein
MAVAPHTPFIGSAWIEMVDIDPVAIAPSTGIVIP